MAMNRHLNVLIPDDLLEALDAFAAEYGANRSEVTRLAIWRLLNAPEPYVAPTLPNWQTEAWTALLRGLFGVEYLVLSDNVRNLLEGALEGAAGALDERQARVLSLRFGLDGPRHTGAEVAAIMGWEGGRQRAHQVETLALRRMRGLLRRSGIWELLKGQLELDKDI